MVSAKRKTSIDPSTNPGPPKRLKALTRDRSFFQDALLFTYKRLRLSENAVVLLKRLDDVRLGNLDKDDFARHIRLSPALSKAILDTINHCSSVLVEKPAEGVECSRIISKCTEMVEIARQRTVPGLPFFKFPREIRDRIYEFYFESQFKGKNRAVRPIYETEPVCVKEKCCPAWDPIASFKMSLIRTCSRVHNEVLPKFYNKYTLSFNCTCTMRNFFDQNSLAAGNVRSLRFYWQGPASDSAIPILYRCAELKNVIILVSKMTLVHPTKREARMKNFFFGIPIKIHDANGIDELIGMRGLETVDVKHAKADAANRITRCSIWSLQNLLDSCVKDQKPEGYGQ